MKIREIKALARANNKKQSSDMMLIGFASTVILSAVSLLTISMGYYVIFGAFQVGLYYAFYKSSQGELIEPKDALYGFKERFGPAFMVGFVLALIETLPKALQVVNVLASLLKLLSTLNISGFGDNTIYGAIGESVSGVLMAIQLLAFVVMLSISMATYLLARDPDMKPKEALITSREMMYGFKFKFLLLQLSFIGWDILDVITLGFAKIYTEAYRISARTVFFNEVYDAYQKKEAELNGEEEQ